MEKLYMESTQNRATTVPERPPQSDNKNQVIPFQPRGGAASWWPARASGLRPPDTPVENLDNYEREHTDDYKHRMQMNFLALAVTVGLIVAAVWIAKTIAEIREQQDCFLSSQRNCAPIDVPTARRN